MSSRVGIGDTEPIINEPFVDTNGALATGLSPTVRISREDGQFWTGTGYQLAPVDLAMTEIDASNLPGLYAYAFIATSGQAVEEQHLVRIDANDTSVVNGVSQTGVFRVGWSDVRDAILSAVLGSGENLATTLQNIARILGLDSAHTVTFTPSQISVAPDGGGADVLVQAVGGNGETLTTVDRTT